MIRKQNTLLYIYSIIFQMLSKCDEYRQMIQEATKRIVLFPNANNQQQEYNFTSQCIIILPSSYPFRSSQQIERNMSITHHITHQLSQYPTSLSNNWPKTCIGLVLCQHHQNNQTYYVYGTGILIHRKIVLTSAQNVYCRRLNTQYTNIRFIVGVYGDKCSGIYDAMRVHYAKKYTMQQYENFAVLQLYDDLTFNCGYVGWKTFENIEEDEKYTLYGYISTNQEGFFNLRQITKHQNKLDCLGSAVLVKENQNKYYIVGLQSSENTYILNEKIRNITNQWTQFTEIDLGILFKAGNYIGAQVCKYLSQTNWIHLTRINLCNHNILLEDDNKIGAQGCKHLSKANWTHLTSINLYGNNITAQECKYLSQANWTHLITINLNRNNIDAQGCRYLSQSYFTHLKQIYLNGNNINSQGCKYLSQANWTHLTQIDLQGNDVTAQGCKHLSQANWTHLTTINLNRNDIDAQGCKSLSQTNWAHLTQIHLSYNSIDVQGCKYLNQTNWTYLTNIQLRDNSIYGIIYQLLLYQSYPNTTYW